MDAEGSPREPVAPGAEGQAGARPVSNLWILGTMVLLLALVGGIAFLVMPRGEVLDAEEARLELFASVAQPLPYGLVAKEARRLPGKELVLVYARAEDGSSDGLDDPIELTFMEFPTQKAESVLEEQFQRLRFEDSDKGRGRGRGGRGRGRGSRGGGGDGGEEGGSGGSSKPTLQDAGFLDWQGYSANYARLRHRAPDDEDKGGASSDDTTGEAGGAPLEFAEAAAEAPAGSPAEEAAAVDAPGEPGADLVGEPAGEPENESRGGADGQPEGEGKANAGAKKKEPKTYDTVRVNLSTGGRCIIAYVKFPVGGTGSKEVVQELLRCYEPLPKSLGQSGQ